jgi:hypothetical protein
VRLPKRFFENPKNSTMRCFRYTTGRVRGLRPVRLARCTLVRGISRYRRGRFVWIDTQVLGKLSSGSRCLTVRLRY